VTTRLYTHPACRLHSNPPGHPERPARLVALETAFAGPGFAALERHEAPLGEEALFLLAHPADHIERLRTAMPESGFVRIDADTTANPHSWESARRAAGAAVDAVDAVMTGAARNAFAAIRPPGHHAETRRPMGFCIVNNVAIAARHAQRKHGAERVAIVDFDVHHGNGTQEIFEADRSVLFASSHEMPLYPGTGEVGETGVGNVFNAPLRAGDAGERFREAWQTRILPAVDRFRPDLILVSAGFDAHWRDPLANLQLTGGDFDWVTGRILDLAERHCDGRIVSLLEGGYDLEGLAEGAAAHVHRLMNG